jgi:hypothetical protein
MTDRAAAARPRPGALRWCPAWPPTGWPGRRYRLVRKRRPAASERLVPGRTPPLRLRSPFQSARAHRLGVSVFSRSRYPITTGLRCDKRSAHLFSITARHVDNSSFLCMHRMWLALSQVKGPVRARPGSGIPSISTARPQARGRCAQVIHMFAHTPQESSPLAGGQAAAEYRAGARVLGKHADREDLVRAQTRPPAKATTGARRLKDRTPAHPPPARPAWQGGLRAHRFSASCLSSRRSRPKTSPVLSLDPDHHGKRSGGYQARRSRRQTFLPDRIRQGPSMYEMEGPRPASPHPLASCLAWPTPRAARRGQVPARGTGLPVPPHVPGCPQVVPVSER